MNDEIAQKKDLENAIDEKSIEDDTHDNQSFTDKKATHPIALSIDKLITRISDIKLSVNKFISHAEKWIIDEQKTALIELDEIIKLLRNKRIQNRAPAIKKLVDTTYRLKRIHESELLNIHLTGHLLTIFSSFDAYIGDLLESIYRKKPELFMQLNRSMTISEMLQYKAVEDIKDIVLKSEIESFRRKSYIEQFDLLENRFGIQLKKFKNWPYFVECSQRRNLFTHCDGIISEQYIAICENENYEINGSIKIGEKIELKSNYLLDSCDIVIEVAFKLGQTLWRKIFDDELELADSHLQSVQYDFLVKEEWGCAKMAGEFASGLRKYSTDVLKTIMTVNYIIALKNCNENDNAIELLNNRDWSALSYDFRLAEKVLRENYDDALEIMHKIGKKSDLVDEHVYHIWPLFDSFRQSEQFQKGYKEIYGYDFSEKLVESASEEKQETEASVVEQEEKYSKNPKTSECQNPFINNAQPVNSADPNGRAAD